MSEQTPPCDCPMAGYCERHKMDKSKGLYNLCKNDDEQRRKWDESIASGRSANGMTMPSLAQRALNFAKANLRFVSMGFKMRDEDEIKRIFDICATCPTGKWDAKDQVCTDCGCKVNKARRIFFNKMGQSSKAKKYSC